MPTNQHRYLNVKMGDVDRTTERKKKLSISELKRVRIIISIPQFLSMTYVGMTGQAAESRE